MSKLNEIKDLKQKEALRSWQGQNFVGSVILATGVGKTRVGVLAAGRLLERGLIKSVLIIVPSTNLRDNEWPRNFVEWGYGPYLTNVTISCVQTSYKDPTHYDLVIVDEVHTALSPEYRAVLEPERYTYLLGLTATPPENIEYLELLQKVAPICYELSQAESIDLGLISSYTTFNLAVSFTPRERFMYKKFNESYLKAKYELDKFIRDNKVPNDAFGLASMVQRESNHPMNKAARAFWGGMQMRKQVCFEAENKIKVLKEIVNHFPDKKYIVFSESIKFAELAANQLGCPVYHSLQNKNLRAEILKEMATKKHKGISTAKALNAGYDLADIDLGICCSGNSTQLVDIQRTGRTLRLKEGKTEAIYFNLFVPGTQEEVWVKKRTEANPNVKWIQSLSDCFPPSVPV